MKGALLYEWNRITSVRSTYWLSGIALGLSACIAFFISVGFNSSNFTSDGVSNYLQASTLVVTAGGSVFIVPVLSAPFCGVIGAMAFGHEYRYGTIKQTLTAIPDRVHVFVGKLLILIGWLLGLMIAIVLVNAALGVLFLDSFTVSGPMVRPVVDFALYNVAFGIAGFAWAAMLRNLAGALIAVLVYPFVIEPIAFNVVRLVHIGNFGRLANLMPAAAGRRTLFSPYELFANPLADSSGRIVHVWGVAASTVVLWSGVVLVLVVALTFFLRRDA